MEDEKVFIELCKKKLAMKLNWPTDKALKQRDFEYLSSEIFKQTKIELSTATLRRIWSNNYKSLPQVHTLNALAQFLGYVDWHDLKAKEETQLPDNKRPQRPVKKTVLFSLMIIVLSIVLIVIVTSWSGTHSKPEVNLFIDQSPTGSVPATVGFRYDISEAKRPVSIELSWNPFERTVLNPEDSFYTGVYYYPDYHKTKLLQDGEVLVEVPVYVTTSGWHALVMKKENDIHPIYIEKHDFLKDGQMGFDREGLAPYLLSQPELIHSVFTLSDSILTAFSGDDMTLKTRVKHFVHKSDPACVRFILLLKAEHGNVLIPIMKKGCYGNYAISFSELVISGKTRDLSELSYDLQNYVDIRLTVKDHRVSLQVGDNPVYEFAYQQSLGALKVAKLMINGVGSVDHFSVSDALHNYEEDFSGY